MKQLKRTEENKQVIRLKSVSGGSNKRGQQKIIITESRTLHVLNLTDILYVAASGSYSTVVLKSGKKIMCSKGLKTIYEQLPQTLFVKTHQSAVVQINEITEVRNSSVLLRDCIELPCSRRLRIPLIKLLEMKYISNAT